jgi:hypothetical protein
LPASVALTAILALASPGAAAEKPTLLLATSSDKGQHALDRLCQWAAQAGLQSRYDKVVWWFTPTVKARALVGNQPPSDRLDKFFDWFASAAAAKGQFRVCGGKSQQVNLSRSTECLVLDVPDPGEKIGPDKDATTVRFELLSKAAEPTPGGGPGHAYYTRLGDPVDVTKFVGCLAWHLWNIPDGLSAPGPSCQHRGLRPEPLAAQATPPRAPTDPAPTPSPTTVPSVPPGVAATATDQSSRPKIRSLISRYWPVGLVVAVGVGVGSYFGLRALDLAGACPACSQTRHQEALNAAHLSTGSFAVTAIVSGLMVWQTRSRSPQAQALPPSLRVAGYPGWGARQLTLAGTW